MNLISLFQLLDVVTSHDIVARGLPRFIIFIVIIVGLSIMISLYIIKHNQEITSTKETKDQDKSTSDKND